MSLFRRLPSVHRRRVSSHALLLWGSIALLAPATVSAAPIPETEPNNSSLAANGPFGPDGFTSTINVSDDVDYVIFRLQGRRQITMAFGSVTGCGANVVMASLRVTNADGAYVAGASVANNNTDTDSWTTPRDATEYIARIDGRMGCQTLLKLAPADSLITGPLPTPSFTRTLSASNPGSVGQAVTVPITATGAAADEDRVAVLWTIGGCPAAPDLATRGIVLGATLATGPYSVTLNTTSPSVPGTATLCTWLYDTLGKLEPLLRQQAVTVVAPPVDNDRDGVAAGPDCNDNESAIKPGAVEIRGNKVDENCDGRAEPYPQGPATFTLTSSSVPGGRTRIKSLVVRQVNRAFAVRVRCTGGGCRARVNRTFTVPPGSQKLSLTSRVSGMRLAPGATLSIKVSGSGYLSRVFVYTMRRGRPPSRSARCANPGATATFAC